MKRLPGGLKCHAPPFPPDGWHLSGAACLIIVRRLSDESILVPNEYSLKVSHFDPPSKRSSLILPGYIELFISENVAQLIVFFFSAVFLQKFLLVSGISPAYVVAQ